MQKDLKNKPVISNDINTADVSVCWVLLTGDGNLKADLDMSSLKLLSFIPNNVQIFSLEKAFRPRLLN